MSDVLEEMVDVLVGVGPFAYGREDSITQTAMEWLDSGFSPTEAHEWLDTAKCFDPAAARALVDAGLDPDQAGAKVNGQAIGALVSAGVMTVAEARERTEPLRQRYKW